MEKSFKSILTLIVLVFALHVDAYAKVTKINDKSKYYQLRSMEDGKWEFHPGWYYLVFHPDYCGGYWGGFLGLEIEWDIKKSDVGQVAPLRVEQVAIEKMSSNAIQAQIDTIKPLAIEEAVRFAEREVDVAYTVYSSTFKKLMDSIDEMLINANIKSEGALATRISALLDEKDLIKEEIDYIHESGLNAQMENAKRELAYEEVEKKLKNLSSKAYRLLYYSQTIYNSNH